MFEAAPAGPKISLFCPKDAAGRGNAIEFGRFHIVAASEPMKQVLSFAVRVARSEATTVLLEGESGTGKDLMAQFLHYSSNRRTGPFVAVNCSAIPEALLESELFGREPGAYTDARTQKKGCWKSRAVEPCSWTRSGTCRRVSGEVFTGFGAAILP